MIALIAQDPDVLSGGAGWAGAGLLGLVLSWLLLVHLPAKDKQLKEIIDQHYTESGRQRADFGMQLDRIAKHCEMEMERANEQFQTSIQRVTDTFFSAVEKLRESINGKATR